MFILKCLFLKSSKRFFGYNIDHTTPYSAGAATAYLCGVKAQLGTIGVDGRTKRGNCSSSLGAIITSILDWAQQLGKNFFLNKIKCVFVLIKVNKLAL